MGLIPKPAHLGPRYGAQFEDETVARAYRTRPPYPAELFAKLATLMPAGPRNVLDLGCGTGDVALGMLGRADRIDAVDPSDAMLRVARAREGAQHPSLRWLRASAEAFRPDLAYSLVVAAESFHWVEWHEVVPWIADALVPGAFLALVSGRELAGVPWSRELGELIPRYSTNQEYRPYDLVAELSRRELFVEVGRWATSVPCEQPVADYVESFHTRNGLSRERMTRAAAESFDAALRLIVLAHCPDGVIRGETRTSVVWGSVMRVETPC